VPQRHPSFGHRAVAARPSDGVEQLAHHIARGDNTEQSFFFQAKFLPDGRQGSRTPPSKNNIWWTILKLARTIFAPRFARGGGEVKK
jgi:hypothetical protein